MLTGDLNVAVVEWIVQYRVADSYQYRRALPREVADERRVRVLMRRYRCTLTRDPRRQSGAR
jgi:hypothetical protein